MLDIKSFAFAATYLLIGLFCFLWCGNAALRQRYAKIMVVLVLLTQGAAFLSPNVLIYNSVVGIALFVACRDRRMISPLYLFLLVTLPMPSKVIAVGGTYIMGYDAAISLALGGTFAIWARARGKFRRNPMWDALAGILFLLYVMPSIRDTTLTNVMRVLLENGATTLLPYYVITRSLRSFDDVRESVFGFLAGISALSTLAMYEAYRTWPLYRSISDHYGIGGGFRAVKIRGGLLRAYGPYPESTSFALCLTIGLIVAYGSRRLFATPAKRNIALVVFLLGALAPQSRGAWLGLVAGIAAVDLFDRRGGALVKKAVTGGIVVGILMAGATVSPAFRKLPGMSGEGSDTVDYRSQLFDRGVEEIRRYPLFGRTPVAVQAAMADLRQGEGIIDFVNTYIYIGLVTGIPGLIAFLYMFGQPLVSLWKARSSFAQRYFGAFRDSSSASAIFGSIVAMVVMISVTSMVNRTTTLIVIQLGLTGVILNAMRQARRDPMRAAQAGASTDTPAGKPDATGDRVTAGATA